MIRNTSYCRCMALLTLFGPLRQPIFMRNPSSDVLLLWIWNGVFSAAAQNYGFDWYVVPEDNTPDLESSDLHAVESIAGTPHALAVGSSDMILYSEDWGLSWTRQYTGLGRDAHWYGAEILEENAGIIAWIVGTGGRVRGLCTFPKYIRQSSISYVDTFMRVEFNKPYWILSHFCCYNIVPNTFVWLATTLFSFEYCSCHTCFSDNNTSILRNTRSFHLQYEMLKFRLARSELQYSVSSCFLTVSFQANNFFAQKPVT